MRRMDSLSKSITSLSMALSVFASLPSSCRAQQTIGTLAATRTLETRQGPSFPTVLGQQITLSEFRGETVLIAFLQILPDTEESESKEELQYLRSMATQYRHEGLQVIVVDESYLITHVPSPPNDLLNAVYDLNLGTLALIPDSSGNIRTAFQVKKLPTTVLLDSSGHLVKRWNRIVLPAFLSESIESASERKAESKKHPQTTR
jgi:hypothetical protein